MQEAKQIISFVRELYSSNEFIPLHAPSFLGNEKKYVSDTIDSTFVSSVGAYVDKFEQQVAEYTQTSFAIATVNGTAALSTALYMASVSAGDLVITQALTFVATCNALHHLGAKPIFIDVEKDGLGLCPIALETWLTTNADIDNDGQCRHRASGAAIKAVVPMHTFGHPAKLDELSDACKKWGLCMIEDAAESLGSFYKGRHTGTIGRFSALSFNGNKVITTGGGGMLLCQEKDDATRAKHLTTTAKTPHPFEFFHDQPGFNYRLPNLNAALGCAQMEQLKDKLDDKRRIAKAYQEFFSSSDFRFVEEPSYARSNYWLNAIECPDLETRNQLLEECNEAGVMTRPVWKLMHNLPMYRDALRGDLTVSTELENTLVNLPSSPLEV